MFLKGIAFVSARNRTVFLAIERWRSHKILTANLTNKMHLVSGLIFISAINTAGYSLLCSAQRNIKSFSAINTNKVNTVFFIVWLFVLMVTLRRAIFNIFSARLPDKFSTTSAIKFTYSVFHYNTPATIFSVFTITQRPIAVNRWLDPHVGSASSLIACYDMGFDAVGFELDKDYYEASKKRLEEFMAQGRLFDD